MPSVPRVSPATGNPTCPSYIHTTDCSFVDNAGRTLLLRGVNLSGASKAPVDRPSYLLEDLWETAETGGESFIGRPLNVDDGSADVHLARLRGWGFNMLRFPVTWEALEHQGPRKYDYEFMDYTVRVLRKCKEYGFRVYIDPHQDTWSRFSGGSGAPYWTLPACGINPRNFTATQAAILHSEFPAAHDPDPAKLPAMIWSTNYGRLASQTLFTLFFAGSDFAPKCTLDGENIQDWLQGHYIAAFGELADRIRDAGDLLEECVIGWDSLNEPFEGLCGWPDLNATPLKQGSTLKKGTYPTPAQSLRLGMGQPQTVDNWTFSAMGPARNGSVTIDPKGRKIWSDPATEPDGVHPRWGWRRGPEWKLGECIWAQHGVWDIETGYVMRADYFRYIPGADHSEDLDFIAEYWRTHWHLFARRIRESHPEAIMFIQPPVFAPPPHIGEEELQGRCAYSGHYYDGLTLITRHWNWFNADALGLLRGKYSSTLQAVKIGETAIRKSLQEQLGILQSDALILGKYPTIIGEIGTPFDMDKKRSYGWTDHGKYKGDYSRQEKALDASLNGGDGPNALSWTVWTYAPDHSHDWGDGWNMEDLSLWSEDDLRDADSAVPSVYRMGSEAGLLRRPQSREESLKSVRTAAASSLSLATLGLGAGTVFDEIAAQRDASARAGWHENPYAFLTDGARAVRAFSRPWPWKIVGKAKDIKFDIKRAEFKLVVAVRPEDKVGVLGGPEDKEAGEPLSTEIYVPLVHYAHDRFLRAREQGAYGSAATTHGGASDGDSVRGSGKASLNASSVHLPSLPRSMSSMSTATGSPELRGIAPYSDKDMLDLDVRVSHGRWAVEGQVLKWWYDVPSAGAPPREYTIEIRRRGRPIGAKEVAGQGEGSWLDKVCSSEACCIM